MPTLSAEELLHLGLYATHHNDPRQAIECLKQCLEIEPENPQAVYLLGALYAEIGMYDRAEESLTRAIRLDPQQYSAVFQLGLLYLTRAQVERATEVWSGLDALPEANCFNLFRHAMLSLARDDFSRCITLIEQGIEANTDNVPLNNDMANIKAAAQSALQRAVAAPGATPQAEGMNGHHLLGSYKRQNRH